MAKKVKMVSLKRFNTRTVADLDLIDPLNKQPTGITLQLEGADSDNWQKASRSLLRSIKDDDLDHLSPEISKLRAQAYAKITIGWSEFCLGEDLNGVSGDEVYTCTQDNAAMLYEYFDTIREQVDNFISERENFIKK